MTKEERTKLIKHLKYSQSIGADYWLTDNDVNEIIKALEEIPKPDKLDDKKEICKALVPVLKMTSNLYDLIDLEYVGDGIEVVIATFESGYKKSANVSMDSGTSMIRDIIRQIV